jgi:MerR family transcriptional regulator, heat shock protein HspR
MTDEFAADQMSDAKVLIISVAARMVGMHPQTLRQYDRLGLVEAARTPGGGRRYSVRDVELLREVQRLSQDEGINLAGVKRIIELAQMVAELQQRLDGVTTRLDAAYQRITELETLSPFPRRDLMPTSRTSTEVILYRSP